MSRFISILLLPLLVGCGSDNTNVEDWKPEIKISTNDDASSLDPRMVRDLSTITPIQMLYEGLMRAQEGGTLTPGVAKSYEVSHDLVTYTFHLRDAYWSNGDPVTAYDFEETWKSILNPRFPAPNAYQLYGIKGAKEAKEGKVSLDDVAVYARDADTLVVELDSPTPYFLELTATHFYFPVHASMREEENPQVITNGPFMLHHWKRDNEMGVVKNPFYWDKEKVKLHAISLIVIDEHTALQMFETGSLDWVGSPMSTLPQDAIQSLKESGRLLVAPAAGTHWFRFNTAREPFNQLEVRRAFGLAIDRDAIVEHVTQGNQTPATGIVPPTFKLQEEPYFHDHDVEQARTLFGERKNLPVIKLTYATSDRNHKVAQAVQEQWRKAFGVDVILENMESKVFFDKLKRRDYQIAIGSWYGDIRDPINFLEVFKYRENSTNNTQWESPVYTALLDLSHNQHHPAKRKHFLKKAEALLMEEMPVTPLFHGAYNYLKKETIQQVHFSDLGYLDFKEAYVE